MAQRSERIKEWKLDQVGVWRVPYLVAGWLVTAFSGDPDLVFIQESEDPEHTLARNSIRLTKQHAYPEDRQIYIVNTSAQAGKTLKLSLLGRGEESGAGLYAGPLTDAAGTVINPATKEGQAALQALIGEVQASPTTYTLLERLKVLATLGGNHGALVAGAKVVPTGTAEAIAGSQIIPGGVGVVVLSLSTNTVVIFVGPAGTAVADGFELAPGKTITLYPDNLNLIFCISGSAAQNLRYIAEVAP